MGCDEGLVAGNDAGPGLEGGQDEGAGRLDPADELNDQVVPGGDSGGVIGKKVPGDGGVTRRVDITDGDARDLKTCAGAGGEVVGLLAEEANDLAANGPGAEDADDECALGG